MSPIQPVRSVSAVDSWISISTTRSPFFRGAALSAKLWGIEQRKRFQRASQAQASKTKSPEVLKVPLHVTMWPGSGLDIPALKTLVDQASTFLRPAGFELQLNRPHEGSGEFEVSKDCPFLGDLEHGSGWLHLALIPDATVQIYSCGLCLVMPADTGPRKLAFNLMRLLGVPEENRGTKQSPGMSRWLKAQVTALLGGRAQLPALTMPIWAYTLDFPERYRSSRTRKEFLKLLELANQAWEPAGIEFQLRAWCVVRERELESDFELESGPWQSLSEHGPDSLHLFMVAGGSVDWELAAYSHISCALVSDSLQWNSHRSLAHTLGLLLGLPVTEHGNQLMACQSQGERLSSREIWTARKYVQELALLEKKPDIFAKPRFEKQVERLTTQQKTVSIRVHLPEGIEQVVVEGWLEKVNRIFEPAGICLRPSFCSWDPPRTFPKLLKPRNPTSTWRVLTESPGYQNWMPNLFLVKELRGHKRHASKLTPLLSCLLVAQHFGQHSPEKQIAFAFARYWGLKYEYDGPYYRLMTCYSPGLRLTQEQVNSLIRKFEPKREIVASSESLIRVPVILSLVNQAGGMNLDELTRTWQQVNSIWSQAGIFWELRDCRHLQIFEEEKKLFRPDQNTPFSFGLDPNIFHVLVVDEILVPGEATRYMHKAFVKAVATAVSIAGISFDLCLSQGLAYFLGLKLRAQGDPKLLTELKGGFAFAPSEIKKARTQVLSLAGKWDIEAYEGDEAPIVIPVNVFIVNEAMGLNPPKFESTWKEVQSIWSQAGIRLELRGCTGLSLNEDRVDDLRHRDAAFLELDRLQPALKLILVEGIKSGVSHRIFHSQQTVVLDVAFARTPVVLCLARTLLYVFQVPAVTAEPGLLTTHYQNGCRLTTKDVKKSRRWAERLLEAMHPEPPENLVECLSPLQAIVQLYVLKGTVLEAEQLGRIKEAAHFWQKAGLALQVEEPIEIDMSREKLQDWLDNCQSMEDSLGTLGEHLRTPDSRFSLLVIAEDSIEVSGGQTEGLTVKAHGFGVRVAGLAANYVLTLGMLLNLDQNIFLSPDRAMADGSGSELSGLEIYKARSYLQQIQDSGFESVGEDDRPLEE